MSSGRSSRAVAVDGPVSPLGYRPQLDGLRTVAVLAVVGVHTNDRLALASFKVIPGGFLGVDLFFVLSGFLITSILLEERYSSGMVKVGRFYQRRALRLLPALGVVLVAHAVWARAVGLSMGAEAAAVVSAIFYVTNIVIAAGHEPPRGLAHLWSLAVEEQFYLVWPLLLLGLVRLRPTRRALGGIIVAGIAVSTVAAAWRWASSPDWREITVRTDLHASGLLAGAFLGVMWPLLPRARRVIRPLSRLGWVVAAGFLLAAHISAGWMYQGGYTLFALAAATMVAGAAIEVGPFRRLLTSPPCAWIGRRSYGLYLWHFPIIVAVARAGGGWPSPARVLVAWTLSLLATGLSYRYVESPFLRMKARLGATSARPPVPA